MRPQIDTNNGTKCCDAVVFQPWAKCAPLSLLVKRIQLMFFHDGESGYVERLPHEGGLDHPRVADDELLRPHHSSFRSRLA
jgi:hypothetical protein